MPIYMNMFYLHFVNTHICSDAGTVDDIMDDIQEEKDIADQISEAISRPGQELFEDVRENAVPNIYPMLCMSSFSMMVK